MSQTNLIRRLRRSAVKIARILLRREFAGRQYTAYDDDICLVAYPKSGNTWLRFLVGNLVHPQNPVSFANLEARVPSIYQNPDHLLRQVPRPRILKSHEAFFSRHRKVIYVVRDPVVAGLGFAAVRDFASYAKQAPDALVPAARQ